MGVWYVNTRPAVVAPPPIPPEIPDPTVRQALTQAREAVEKDPTTADPWGELGLVFRAHELDPQAVSCFSQAARLDPQDPHWPYLVGTTNIRLNLADVIPHLREAERLATTPELKSAARLRLAETLFELGEPDEAGRLFTEELQADPANPRVHLGLGMVALARDAVAEAVPHLEAAARTPFAQRKAGALLATAYRRLGKPDAASQTEVRASAGGKDVSWPDPFVAGYMTRQVGRQEQIRRVDELEAQGRFREAAAVLEELVQAYPDDQTFVSLGKVLARSGDLPRAELALREALRQNPDHAAAHFFLGMTLSLVAERATGRGEKDQATRNDQEAVDEFRRCIALKPDHGPAHLYAARALRRLGRLPEAMEVCRGAIRISPNVAETHLVMGDILMASGKPRDAIPYLEEAVRLSPPRDNRANALLEQAKAARKE
ncbi:TPR repeat [Fimbriiglobus ruber]|uniref:TPR repeat n=1 Tax=Fimbriiglobus ruber TaxID=1908690 RepID=A0A225DFD3_9BACT|nr:TPR repeat [Fimbriiglobus ruber]